VTRPPTDAAYNYKYQIMMSVAIDSAITATQTISVMSPRVIRAV
jgi:hypothetical protein